MLIRSHYFLVNMLGAICIELVKSGCNANLSLGSRRLMRIASDAVCKLPIAGLLLAQAHPAKVGTPGWQRLIRTEWSLWPQGKFIMRIFVCKVITV